MGASGTRAIAHRPRWRAYLLLARVSNLPTVWTNVLAGMAAAGRLPDWPTFVQIAAAVSLFYSGGMLLNDACDAEADSRSRPERPIPSGDVTRAEVFAVAFLLLGLGELFLAPHALAMSLGLILIAAIALYDFWHKGFGIAPLVMGACRALVYAVAAAAAGNLTATAGVGAAIIGAYVVGLTVVARVSGPKASWRVPMLIAGISLVDALFIAIVSASASVATLAASAFLLTLLLQRFVPGD